MPLKIPDQNALGARPSLQPATGVARYRGDDPDLEKPGQALMHQGAVAGSEADKLFHQYKVEQERADLLRAEDAFTKLREQQLDLTIGQKNGYENLRGSQVATQPVMTDWSKKFDDQVDLIAGGLANDEQREKFRHRASVARMQYNEGLARHVVKEGDRYAKEVFDGTIRTETRQSIANWNDPMAVGTSIARVDAAIEDQAERNHWPAEFKEAERLKAQGGIHTAVIGQALAEGNYVYAQAWYEEHKADVDLPTAKALERAVQDGTQKQLTAGYTSTFLANQDNRKVLEALHTQVLGDEQLDDTRKNIVVGRIQSRMALLDVRAEREAARQERVLSKAINQVNALTLAGFEPTVQQMAPLVAAAKGTALEGDVQQMVQTVQATAKFRTALPQMQEAYLTNLETAIRKDPTKFDVTVLSKFRTIYENQQKAIKEDPVSFAVRQGQVAASDPASQPLDLSNPAAAGPQLQARFDLARSLGAKYQAPFKPLTKEEADTLGGAIAKAPVQQQREYFAMLSQATAGDRDGYKAMMAQIAPDNPVLAVAGIYAGRNLEAGPGKNVAESILRGQALLRPNKHEDGKPEGGKLWPMPPEKDMDKVFNSTERDAFAGHGQLRSTYLQTAKAIYADLSNQAGDASGVLDGKRWDQAIQQATGGIEKYKGRGVLMPWGYTYGQFVDGLAQRTEIIAASGRLADGVSASKLRDMPLEIAGDGRYFFKAGDGILVDKQNKPVVLDFNQSLPYHPSGEGKGAKPEPDAYTKALRRTAVGSLGQ